VGGVFSIMDVDEFFDENYNVYGQKASTSDFDFLGFIKSNQNQNITLLDVGGGNGYFSELIYQNCPNIGLTVLDPSKKLLNEINNPNINKVVGKLPDDVSLNSKFDYIHVRAVLHHITGNTVSNSTELLKRSIICLKNLLKDGGFILITEIYYEGYLIPKLPRYLIFYLLKLQNKFNIKIPFKDFLLGLEVCFYTRKELEMILKECGLEIVDIKSYKRGNNFQKMMLIKNLGKVSIIARMASKFNED
jgi:SAM-dependent methyltransferase